jgi:hypothetical protein
VLGFPEVWVETFRLVLSIFYKRGHFSFNPEKRESDIFLLRFMDVT